jgi:hypothetical protein
VWRHTLARAVRWTYRPGASLWPARPRVPTAAPLTSATRATHRHCATHSAHCSALSSCRPLADSIFRGSRDSATKSGFETLFLA